MKYNGWANRATWNVALWLDNDESLYRFARKFRNYSELASALAEQGITSTPDGYSYSDPSLDVGELNIMLADNE